MANMSPKKNPIPEQDPNVRNKNFEEVALGYTVEMAVDEANRCLNCPRPACMSAARSMSRSRTFIRPRP